MYVGVCAPTILRKYLWSCENICVCVRPWTVRIFIHPGSCENVCVCTHDPASVFVCVCACTCVILCVCVLWCFGWIGILIIVLLHHWGKSEGEWCSLNPAGMIFLLHHWLAVAGIFLLHHWLAVAGIFLLHYWLAVAGIFLLHHWLAVVFVSSKLLCN